VITATFGIEKESLADLLREAEHGKAQLPDFQRGWAWDDAHVKALLASISMSYPIGTVMLLRAGGDSLRFKQRPIEGATPPASERPERLILDGQQRLTSLFQSLLLGQPVLTHDQRGKPIERWYYVDMERALDPRGDREEAIVSLPGNRVIRNFRNDLVEDYSTPEREYAAMLFPLTQVFHSADWRTGFFAHWDYDRDHIKLWDRFEAEVVKRFEQYHLPVIELAKETPKEAVCQVFEKVNTGGVTLTVFELLTATFAADDFDLRGDWESRQRRLAAHKVLDEFSNTDFLQAVTLLASWQRRDAAIAQGADDDRAPAIGCKRADMLRLSLADYQQWADRVVAGLEQAARFLHGQHLFETRFLPYGGQLIPLSAILPVLGRRWEVQGVRDKLARWLWCGVFGELYGGTTETRFARDLPDVLAWVDGGSEPRTVVDAVFAPARLLSLRTRGSAAYKGIYALLLREGARDVRTGEPSNVQNYFDERVDIHHLFPQRWCRSQSIPPALCDSIINKTPLSARTNRVIGGRAPSEYLSRLQNSAGITVEQLDANLRTHLVDPAMLRADDFHRFFAARKAALLGRIEQVTGKRIDPGIPAEPEDEPTEYEVIDGYDDLEGDAA
jgi:hypothetical protein